MLLNHGTILTIGCCHSRIKLTLHIAIKMTAICTWSTILKIQRSLFFCNFSNRQSCHRRNRQEYRDRLDPTHIAHGIGPSSQGSQR